MNDDVLPEPGLLQAHRAAHEQRLGLPPAMVVGFSPFVVREAVEETVFDRLVRETSMIFFYDRMMNDVGEASMPRDHDWGFRHAWTLNLSIPAVAARAVGGFRPAIANCCYEDIEFAWRAARELGAPVLFRPDARAPHDHRFTPAAYLERERRLGYSALGFALAAPQCAAEVFGRELTNPEEVSYFKAFLEREAGWLDGLRAWFETLGHTLARDDDLAARGSARHRAALQQHVPLKRAAFREGFLHAMAGGRIEGLFHPSDGVPIEPPLDTRGASRLCVR